MKIAILHFHRLGGSGVIAYELAKAMLEKGHEIHFVGLQPPFRMTNMTDLDNNSLGVHFHKVNFEPYPVFDFQPYSFALASQLSEVIKEHNIDIIHSHYAIPHATVALLAREISGRDVKCITTLHGTDITIVGTDPSMHCITKYSIEKSDYVTAVSQYLKDETNDYFGFDSDKVKMIHNFIDTDNRPNEYSLLKREGFFDKKEIILFHSSNLREVKAPADVINIFNRTVDKAKAAGIDKKLTLWVFGEGPLKGMMMKMSRDLGLCNQVKFWGEQVHLDDFIKRSDFFLFPSLEESFGLSALEAMAFGVVVIARKVGGIPELVTDGKDGILFPSDQVERASDALVQLLKNPERYEELSRNAFNTVQTRFKKEHIIPKFEKLYLD